jgi:hypothetical protein
MAKLTTTDLSNLTNEASAVAVINANNAAIEAALENTVSRDGTSPNEMTGSLDMNSNRILNLAEPQTANEPARLVDITSLLGGGIDEPPAPSAITRGGLYTHPAVASNFLTSINSDGTVTGAQPTVSDLAGGVDWSDLTGIPAYLSTDTTDAANVNFTPSGTGFDIRTVSSKLRETVSVLDYIPTAEHAAILAQTTTYDATVDIQAAIDANAGIRCIHFPSGKYIVTNTLRWRPTPSSTFGSGLKIRGDGAASTIFDNRCAATARSDNFATTNLSNLVTVTRTAHGYAAEDTFEVTGASGAIGGLSFDGTWSINSVTANTFVFTHTSSASSTANGTVTYSQVNPMIDIGTGTTFGKYLQWSDFADFKVDNLTSVANVSAFRLRKSYHCTLENIWIRSQTRDGIQILCIDETAGDRDASNQVTLRHLRIENCDRWAVYANSRTATASGNNETSYLGIHDCFITDCGVDAATSPPVTGAIRWKGQILDVQNTAVAASNNVALYIEGGAGLANSVTVRGFTSENVTRKGIFITGLQQGTFQDIQIYNNDGFVAQSGFRIDGGSFVVANVRVKGCVVRATAGNNAYTAFLLSGANADAKTCYVEKGSVTWSNFDHAGQTRYTGIGTDLAGITDASSAVVGTVGELLSSSVVVGSAVALTTATPANMTSLVLTPGEWDVSLSMSWNLAATTTVTALIASISATSVTLDTTPGNVASFRCASFAPGAAIVGQVVGPVRVNITTNTTYYAVAQATFGTSTNAAYGILRARRVR